MKLFCQLLFVFLSTVRLEASMRSAATRINVLLSQFGTHHQRISRIFEYNLDENSLRKNNEDMLSVIHWHLIEHKHLLRELSSVIIKFVIMSDNPEYLFDTLQEILYKKQFPTNTIEYTTDSVKLLFTFSSDNPSLFKFCI